VKYPTNEIMSTFREYPVIINVIMKDGWVYKRQSKFMTENEYYFLKKMERSGYVPAPVEKVDDECIRMPYIEFEHVTDPRSFMGHLPHVLTHLRLAGIRHGDLSIYGVIVKNNRPVLIDFSESRLWDDPRPDKRPEGDEYWLRQTMMRYCEEKIDVHIR